MSFASTWMDLEIIILKGSKLDKERQLLYGITYKGNLNDDANELVYTTETDRTEWRLLEGQGCYC